MVKQEADQQMVIITLSQFIWSCNQLSSLIKHSSHVLVGCCFYFVLFFVYFGLELNLSSSPSLPIPFLPFSSHLFSPHPSPSLFLPPPFAPNPSPSLFFPTLLSPSLSFPFPPPPFSLHPSPSVFFPPLPSPSLSDEIVLISVKYRLIHWTHLLSKVWTFMHFCCHRVDAVTVTGWRSTY